MDSQKQKIDTNCSLETKLKEGSLGEGAKYAFYLYSSKLLAWNFTSL